MKRTEKEIMAAHIETVHAHLRKLDVEAKDIDDLTQEVMLAAWEKVCEGEFRIHPGVKAEWATHGWLFGIAWRQVSHYRDRAHRRREVLTAAPLREAVEDVVQEVLLQAHQSFSEYRPQYGHVMRWLNRITVHVASHHHDRAFRRRETSGLDEAPEPDDPSLGAVELLQQAEVQQLVFDCIQALPAEMREVIMAHDVDGLSMEEIARRREISLTTAYRLHTQGRVAFKAILLARVCVEEENAKKRRR